MITLKQISKNERIVIMEDTNNIEPYYALKRRYLLFWITEAKLFASVCNGQTMECIIEQLCNKENTGYYKIAKKTFGIK